MGDIPTSFEYSTFLPTLDRLQASKPENVDAREIASTWLNSFTKAVESGNTDNIVSLFVEDALWRDMLALTWDIRTFHKAPKIKKFLEDRLGETKPQNIRLSDDKDKQPSVLDAPGLFWIQAFIDFETAVGVCSGIFRVVPTANGQFKCHTMFTNLEYLKGHPYQSGPLRSWESNHGEWLSQRAKEMTFEDSDPPVLIIGGGQSGLDVAARLKYQGVKSLVLEKNPRIGDNWRNRYQALCLHDPVWYDHMPYLRFPDTWPVFTPAQKLADWLESYAHAMELNVWTSTKVERIERDEAKGEWVVTFIRADGSSRTMRPKHVVLALGIAGNKPRFPKFPGQGEFGGKIVHSLHYGSAMDNIGKKVVVIGACTSAHDISADLYHHGVDVTMVQRSSTYIMSTNRGLPILFEGLYVEGGPPVDIADRINASYPNYLLKQLHKGATQRIAEADRETLEGLKKVGFQTNYGEDDCGFLMMAWKKAGGYYLDVGASQLIIDGKIKFKHGSIKNFSRDGLEFEDGSSLKADVVVFATGLGDYRDAARELLSEEDVQKMKPVWGLDGEGELNGMWRDVGLPNLYVMGGNLALCRFHSTHIALQIKAKEEGVYTKPYSS